jgi:NAD(P)-dependent dehydrogenase (short-subunit alcohol dehydrogenase family)
LKVNAAMNPRNVFAQFSLVGRVAMVTGASGYLGEAIACGLAEAGASVAVTSRSLARAEEVAALLPSEQGARHLGIELDHQNESSIRAAFERTVASLGKIDVLVNNAHEATAKNWRDATLDEFAAQLQNAAGYFALARLVRDDVVRRNAAGSIVMMGSMYGSVSSDPRMYEGIGPPNPVAYQTLKGGVAQLTRHLAVHWARDGVRVNSISPGPFPNPAKASSDLITRLCEKTPMGRIGSPDELKGAVVFLASDASSFVTGHDLAVDGGWTAW